MAYIIVNQNKDTGYTEYICDTIADLSAIPFKEQLFGCVALVSENKTFYIMNSKGQWEVIREIDGGGSDITIESLNITDNGTYTAPENTAYTPITVDVQPDLGTKAISANGTYTASSDELDGYSSVTVDVPANVTNRILQINGTFSSAVDNKDGYSNVTVNVQEAPVKTTSLSVTENGTYAPGPSSEISLTIPTIPDEVETDVSAGAVITNFDNLRIEFTNKTTSATGHVDIYPSAIAVQQIPMSFKNRTLIMGPDGDHYITIVNGYDSIAVLQKGYTITAMKLTTYSGYFSEVDVNVPTGPDIDYLYDWDFTKSLTDKVASQTAQLKNNLLRDSEGLHFTSTAHGCQLVDLNMIGKTIEIDIASINFVNGAPIITNSARLNNAGSSPLTWLSNGWRAQNISGNTSEPYDSELVVNSFSGKTIKLVYLSTSCTLLYVDNIYIGKQDTIAPIPTSHSNRYVFIGGSGYTTSYSNGNCFNNMVVTGCRIYNNILTEKTITQNGTYYAPDDNVDGYLKINANIPLGTKSIAANGTYTASDDSLAGYSDVVVNVASGGNPDELSSTEPKLKHFTEGGSTYVINSDGSMDWTWQGYSAIGNCFSGQVPLKNAKKIIIEIDEYGESYQHYNHVDTRNFNTAIGVTDIPVNTYINLDNLQTNNHLITDVEFNGNTYYGETNIHREIDLTSYIGQDLYLFIQMPGVTLTGLKVTVLYDKFGVYEYHWSNDGKVCVRKGIGETKWFFIGLTKGDADLDLEATYPELFEYIPKNGDIAFAYAYETASSDTAIGYIGLYYYGGTWYIRSWNSTLAYTMGGTFYSSMDVDAGAHQHTEYSNPLNVKAIDETLITKTITENGTYSAEDDGYSGYSDVVVNIPPVGTIIPTIKLESTITLTTEVI